jgi:hypothetical protein
MSEIKEWSTTASQNNAVAPDGFPEGMAPSDVNNAAREVMAAVRTYYDDAEWRDWGHTITYGSATTFTTAAGDGDTTSIYHDGRRVKADGTTTGTIYGTITNQSHSSQTTVTVSWDSGSLQNESLTIQIGSANDVVHAGGVFESGTKISFFQASAPTGWTQDTANTDAVLRVVDSSGGGTGGSSSISSPPEHVHHVYNWVSTVSNATFYNSSGNSTSLTTSTSGTSVGIGAATGPSARIALDFYTEKKVAFTPKYIDVIIAEKD